MPMNKFNGFYYGVGLKLDEKSIKTVSDQIENKLNKTVANVTKEISALQDALKSGSTSADFGPLIKSLNEASGAANSINDADFRALRDQVSNMQTQFDSLSETVSGLGQSLESVAEKFVSVTDRLTEKVERFLKQPAEMRKSMKIDLDNMTNMAKAYSNAIKIDPNVDTSGFKKYFEEFKKQFSGVGDLGEFATKEVADAFFKLGDVLRNSGLPLDEIRSDLIQMTVDLENAFKFKNPERATKVFDVIGYKIDVQSEKLAKARKELKAYEDEQKRLSNMMNGDRVKFTGGRISADDENLDLEQKIAKIKEYEKQIKQLNDIDPGSEKIRLLYKNIISLVENAEKEVSKLDSSSNVKKIWQEYVNTFNIDVTEQFIRDLSDNISDSIAELDTARKEAEQKVNEASKGLADLISEREMLDKKLNKGSNKSNGQSSTKDVKVTIDQTVKLHVEPQTEEWKKDIKTALDSIPPEFRTVKARVKIEDTKKAQKNVHDQLTAEVVGDGKYKEGDKEGQYKDVENFNQRIQALQRALDDSKPEMKKAIKEWRKDFDNGFTFDIKVNGLDKDGYKNINETITNIVDDINVGLANNPLEFTSNIDELVETIQSKLNSLEINEIKAGNISTSGNITGAAQPILLVQPEAVPTSPIRAEQPSLPPVQPENAHVDDDKPVKEKGGHNAKAWEERISNLLAAWAKIEQDKSDAWSKKAQELLFVIDQLKKNPKISTYKDLLASHPSLVGEIKNIRSNNALQTLLDSLQEDALYASNASKNNTKQKTYTDNHILDVITKFMNQADKKSKENGKKTKSAKILSGNVEFLKDLNAIKDSIEKKDGTASSKYNELLLKYSGFIEQLDSARPSSNAQKFLDMMLSDIQLYEEVFGRPVEGLDSVKQSEKWLANGKEIVQFIIKLAELANELKPLRNNKYTQISHDSLDSWISKQKIDLSDIADILGVEKLSKDDLDMFLGTFGMSKDNVTTTERYLRSVYGNNDKNVTTASLLSNLGLDSSKNIIKQADADLSVSKYLGTLLGAIYAFKDQQNELEVALNELKERKSGKIKDFANSFEESENKEEYLVNSMAMLKDVANKKTNTNGKKHIADVLKKYNIDISGFGKAEDANEAWQVIQSSIFGRNQDLLKKQRLGTLTEEEEKSLVDINKRSQNMFKELSAAKNKFGQGYREFVEILEIAKMYSDGAMSLDNIANTASTLVTGGTVTKEKKYANTEENRNLNRVGHTYTTYRRTGGIRDILDAFQFVMRGTDGRSSVGYGMANGVADGKNYLRTGAPFTNIIKVLTKGLENAISIAFKNVSNGVDINLFERFRETNSAPDYKYSAEYQNNEIGRLSREIEIKEAQLNDKKSNIEGLVEETLARLIENAKAPKSVNTEVATPESVSLHKDVLAAENTTQQAKTKLEEANKKYEAAKAAFDASEKRVQELRSKQKDLENVNILDYSKLNGENIESILSLNGKIVKGENGEPDVVEYGEIAKTLKYYQDKSRQDYQLLHDLEAKRDEYKNRYTELDKKQDELIKRIQDVDKDQELSDDSKLRINKQLNDQLADVGREKATMKDQYERTRAMVDNARTAANSSEQYAQQLFGVLESATSKIRDLKDANVEFTANDVIGKDAYSMIIDAARQIPKDIATQLASELASNNTLRSEYAASSSEKVLRDSEYQQAQQDEYSTRVRVAENINRKNSARQTTVEAEIDTDALRTEARRIVETLIAQIATDIEELHARRSNAKRGIFDGRNLKEAYDQNRRNINAYTAQISSLKESLSTRRENLEILKGTDNASESQIKVLQDLITSTEKELKAAKDNLELARDREKELTKEIRKADKEFRSRLGESQDEPESSGSVANQSRHQSPATYVGSGQSAVQSRAIELPEGYSTGSAIIANIAQSGIATEDTLKAIYNLLSGNVGGTEEIDARIEQLRREIEGRENPPKQPPSEPPKNPPSSGGGPKNDGGNNMPSGKPEDKNTGSGKKKNPARQLGQLNRQMTDTKDRIAEITKQLEDGGLAAEQMQAITEEFAKLTAKLPTLEARIAEARAEVEKEEAKRAKNKKDKNTTKEKASKTQQSKGNKQKEKTPEQIAAEQEKERLKTEKAKKNNDKMHWRRNLRKDGLTEEQITAHPEVIRLTNEVEELKKQIAAQNKIINGRAGKKAEAAEKPSNANVETVSKATEEVATEIVQAGAQAAVEAAQQTSQKATSDAGQYEDKIQQSLGKTEKELFTSSMKYMEEVNSGMKTFREHYFTLKDGVVNSVNTGTYANVGGLDPNLSADTRGHMHPRNSLYSSTDIDSIGRLKALNPYDKDVLITPDNVYEISGLNKANLNSLFTLFKEIETTASILAKSGLTKDEAQKIEYAAKLGVLKKSSKTDYINFNAYAKNKDGTLTNITKDISGMSPDLLSGLLTLLNLQEKSNSIIEKYKNNAEQYEKDEEYRGIIAAQDSIFSKVRESQEFKNIISNGQGASLSMPFKGITAVQDYLDNDWDLSELMLKIEDGTESIFDRLMAILKQKESAFAKDSPYFKIKSAYDRNKDNPQFLNDIKPLLKEFFGYGDDGASDYRLKDLYETLAEEKMMQSSSYGYYDNVDTSENRSLAELKAELAQLKAIKNNTPSGVIFATQAKQDEIIGILKSGVKVSGNVNVSGEKDTGEESVTKKEEKNLSAAEQSKQAQAAINQMSNEAKVKIDSTGKQTINTIQKIGAETAKVTTVTEDGVTKSTLELSNKYETAMKSLFQKIRGDDGKYLFGAETVRFGVEATDAQDTLLKYADTYRQLEDAIGQYKQSGDVLLTDGPNKGKQLQTVIDELQVQLGQYEQRLISISNASKQFLGNKAPFAMLNGTQLNDSANSLKLLAVSTEQCAVAFNGVYNNGKKLMYDVLQDGSIKRYSLEVDEATGNVRKMEVSETALVNALQNVNKAAKQSEELNGIFTLDDVNKDAAIVQNYKKNLSDMHNYVREVWEAARENGGLIPIEEQNKIYAMSQEVIRLGAIIKNEYKSIANARDSGTPFIKLDNDDDPAKTESNMQKNLFRYAGEQTMHVSNVQYDSVTKSMTADLVDLSGAITKVKMQYNELLNGVQISSARATNSVDDTTLKMEKLVDTIEIALKSGVINDQLPEYQKFASEFENLDKLIDDIKNGTIAYNRDAIDAWNAQRQAVIDAGDAIAELAKKNAQKSLPGVRAVEAQSNKKIQIDSIMSELSGAASDNSTYKAYVKAYNDMIKLRDGFKSAGTLGLDINQDQLKVAANQVRVLGDEVLALARKSEELQKSVASDDDIKPLSDKFDIANLEEEMRQFAGISERATKEQWKFDNANKSVNYTIKDESNIVHEMCIVYDAYQKQLVRVEKGHYKVKTSLEQFTDSLGSKFKEMARYFMSFGSVYEIFNIIRQGVTYVREIDSALTELKKVTDETDATYDAFLKTMSKTAGVIGSNVKDLTTMAAEWARLGYSIEDAGKLAESTAILLNVSEFENATEASKALISTMQAFQYTADESQHVVDILNEVGNNFAVSSDGLATALQDSASALMEAGNNLEQSVALIAAANRVVQDPSSVGSALRTISLRLRGTSVEVLEEMGEETDGVVESVSKMQKKIKALTGVDILTESGAYKDTYEILREIGAVWKDMSDIDQAALLELMAGIEFYQYVQKCA